jgi:hypothetical protein
MSADVQFSRASLSPAMASRPAPRPSAPALRPLDALVALQRADGSWELDRAFANAVSLTLRDLQKALQGASGDPGISRRALATAIALEWLTAHASRDRGEWELLAAKAARWLSASDTEPAAGQGWQGWLDVARRIV